MILVQKNSNFKFFVQLYNGKIDRFIKLEVFDTDTNFIIGNYSLNHISNGYYSNNSVIANENGVFMAKYTVYRDALFTKLDRRYSIKIDYIRVESIIDTLTETIDFGDGSIA